MENGSVNRIALFFDAENLFIEAGKAAFPVDVPRVLTRLREEGRLVLARAYADWSALPARDHVRTLQQYAVEMVMLPTDQRQKNTADIQMVVDALELTILPDAPDVIALVAGDRDFVPLVQRIKRYGKTVIGMGLRGSTSRSLEAVCTKFLYYDDLFPETAEAAPEEQAAAKARTLEIIESKLDPALLEAYGLLVRAARALQRQDKATSGARLKPMMQQLDPAFDLSRFRFHTFKELVKSAEDAGYVKITASAESTLDFAIEVLREPSTAIHRLTDLPEPGDLRFDTDENALRSYRRILERKGVPLVPWEERRLLVSGLKDRMEEAGRAMEAREVLRALEDISAGHYLRLPERALYKLALTLYISQALRDEGTPEGRIGPPIEMARLRLACDADEALLRMNSAYLTGIKHDHPDAPLRQPAIAQLLFDSVGAEAMDRAAAVMAASEEMRTRRQRAGAR